MSHGGKRANAGRKNGSATKRTAATKAEAVAKGITPAEVLQAIMEHHFDAGEYDKAQSAARDLAPYRHPRLAAVTVKGDPEAPVQLEVSEIVVNSRQQADAILALNGRAAAVPQ